MVSFGGAGVVSSVPLRGIKGVSYYHPLPWDKSQGYSNTKQKIIAQGFILGKQYPQRLQLLLHRINPKAIE